MFNHINYVAMGFVMCVAALVWIFAGFLSVGILFLGIMLGVLLMEVFTEAEEFEAFKRHCKELKDL